ncbi:MAG: DUF1643 domain-containing protein [Clostridiaceae bacterium]|nr:DUF1643 domain-containing protein [Clostridiaceae bacterium]
MEFIKKSQLEKEYIAFGRFYILKYDNGEKKDCRSILEIFERNSCDNLKDTNKIDAVFIMMNPGSGKPMKVYKQQCKSINQVKTGELDKIQLVETDPDDTQYQVMRVMRIMEWKYVRVINLSDYRNPQSESFYPMIKESMPYDSEFIHSIFSKERNQEINNIFKAEDKFKLIAAWGVNTKLNKLIKLTLENNNLIGRVGNNKATYKRKKQFYYYHPLPKNLLKQPLWLKEIIERL